MFWRKQCFLLVILAYTLRICALEQPIMTNIGIKDGLSNGFVVDIAMDNQGFLWAATESGLNRIAGKNCTVFKTSNSGLTTNGLVGLLFEKSANVLWIYSKDGKANVFDCNTHQFSVPQIGLGAGHRGVADVGEAADGGVWIACYDGTIFHYNSLTKANWKIDNKQFRLNKNGVRSIMDDGKGHLYIGLRMDGLIVYDYKRGRVRNFAHDSKDPNSLPGNNVRTVYIDHLQNIWVGTNMGLALFDAAKGTFKSYLQSYAPNGAKIGDNVHGIMEMKDQTLWVSCDLGGIKILDLKSFNPASSQQPHFEHLTKENSALSSNNVRRTLQDSFGNIWVGNYSSGVDCCSYATSHFKTLRLPSLIGKSVTGIFVDNQDALWIGLDDVIVKCQNGQEVGAWNFAPYLTTSSAFVYGCMKDSHDNVWLGLNDNGFLSFNTHNHVFTHYDCLKSLDVHGFCEDTATGKIYVGSEIGLYSYYKGQAQEEAGYNKQLGDNPVIYSLTQDRLGQLWIATLGKGVCVFNRKGKMIAQFNASHLLNTSSCNHLMTDADGGIWMATFEGLAYCPDPANLKHIELYGEQQGLKTPPVRAVVQDRSGNIWMSLFSGISCFDVNKRKFYNYDYQSGIPMGNFVEGSAGITADGTVYFGSPSGVCYFNPQNITEQETLSQVQIIECEKLTSLTDKTIYSIVSPSETGVINLHHDDNTFKFSFTVMDYSQQGDVEYTYMMRGLDGKWYATEGDNEVTFHNLPPGHYTFIVRAKLKNQDWEDASVAEMKVIIAPPFYWSWWAKMLYLLVAVALGVFYFRAYKHRLRLKNSLLLAQQESLQKQEINEERLRFFTNVTHELRTPLTLIIGPLEDLIGDERLPQVLHKKVNSIYASAERLLNLINDILEFRKTETQNRKLTVARADVGILAVEIGEQFKNLNRNPQVEVRIAVEPNLPLVYFDSEVITTVISNLLSNAMKYTPKGVVSLTLKCVEGNGIELAVEDTGYGMAAEALPHVFDRYYQVKGKHQASGTGIGLALVKSLAVLHEAELKVESTLGKGSRFSFVLDKNNTYPSALHKDDEEPAVETPNALSEEDSIAQEDKRPVLLVVEDNADIRQYISDSLAEDYQVLLASNGVEGKDVAFRQIPDIIISDIMMPEMDGITLTKLLKADVQTSHIPVVLLTAKNSMDAQEEGYDSGADSYLTKPFSVKLLRSRLQNLLSNRRRLAELLTARMGRIQATENVQVLYSDASAPQKEPTGSRLLSPLDQTFMEKMNRLIDENMATEDIDMAFMTDKMAMSHSTFYRKVKALTGMTPNEYIRKAKLHRCMQLLKAGNCNVTEAAMQTGFNNMGHFRDCFKREFGITPSEVNAS